MWRHGLTSAASFESTLKNVQANAVDFTMIHFSPGENDSMESGYVPVPKWQLLSLARALTKNTMVTSVTLNGQGFGDEVCEAFAAAIEASPCVEYVSFQQNAIGSDGAEALARAIQYALACSLAHSLSQAAKPQHSVVSAGATSR